MVTITSGTDRDHRDGDRNGTIGSSNPERYKSSKASRHVCVNLCNSSSTINWLMTSLWDGFELRVLTLNMWCLPQPWPVGSKDRKHRLKRLAEALLIEEYDIVGLQAFDSFHSSLHFATELQEIWKEGDYLDLVDQLKDVYKFHHYFHSGWTGSGVCILSRHPIVSTLTHRFIFFFSSECVKLKCTCSDILWMGLLTTFIEAIGSEERFGFFFE